MPSLHVTPESWPIRGSFTISRGAKHEALVVVASLSEGAHTGRGECVPYGRYGETVASVLEQINGLKPRIEAGMTRAQLQGLCPAGAARNALDCALWDLEAKQRGAPVWKLAGLAAPRPCVTAYTLSLDTPAAMGAAAAAAGQFPVLKLKLGADAVLESVSAVHKASPKAKLIIDANEAWDMALLQAVSTRLKALNVVLIEQPLPADRDDALAGQEWPVPLCADESCHGIEGLAQLRPKYALINIKLDKTGGLTGALALARAARHLGFGVMVGCMVSTSLAMAPAMLLAGMADYVDLDGPLLLQHDREGGLRSEPGGILHPPGPALWG
ncbi:MAG: N-acetyl-D-Glu racemase DgcA [Alphaproteobacteria bacterium]